MDIRLGSICKVASVCAGAAGILNADHLPPLMAAVNSGSSVSEPPKVKKNDSPESLVGTWNTAVPFESVALEVVIQFRMFSSK